MKESVKEKGNSKSTFKRRRKKSNKEQDKI
jgi:hypothetical protein